MEFTTVRDITREVRKPGKIYVGMLIQDGVAHIAVEKSDFLQWLVDQNNDAPGVYAVRSDGALYIHNT